MQNVELCENCITALRLKYEKTSIQTRTYKMHDTGDGWNSTKFSKAHVTKSRCRENFETHVSIRLINTVPTFLVVNLKIHSFIHCNYTC